MSPTHGFQFGFEFVDFDFDSKILSFSAEIQTGIKLHDGFAVNGSLHVNEAIVKTSVSEKRANSPIIVIDNYDSFTYNLCQVCFWFSFW